MFDPISSEGSVEIVEIDLSFNNLTGKLPNEISDLTSLRVLNLAFNKLEGELPKTLTDLTNLETLQLFSNNFSGALPKDIGRMENLKTLELYNQRRVKQEQMNLSLHLMAAQFLSIYTNFLRH